MSDLKWADVAHMYTNIECLHDSGVTFTTQWFKPFAGMAHFVTTDIFGKESPQLTTEYKPVLRHVADLVGKELDQYADWLVDLRKSNTASIPSYKTHYLISQGFDVFGLIESGEAIRKEANNV